MASTAPNVELPGFAQLVREHPRSDALGALCCEVLLRGARGQVVPSGAPRKWVKSRARALGVDGRDADTAYGNLLDALARGPEPDATVELVGAFVTWGLGKRLSLTPEPSREAELELLVRWLARRPEYRVFELARELLSGPVLERLAQVLQEACIHVEDRSRADAVELLEALRVVDPHGDHLDALAGVLEDPVLEACADALQGSERVSAPAPVPWHRVHVEGRWVSAKGTSLGRVLGWITGWALLRRLGVWFAWLLRWEARARVSLDGRVVRVERWRSVFGREVHVIDESLRAEEVQAAVRVLQRPVAVTALGVACLLGGFVGLGVGVHLALRQGDFAPVAWGLFALGVGAGFDVLLEFAARARGGKVWLEITAPGRPPLRVAGAPAQAAAQLVRALDELR